MTQVTLNTFPVVSARLTIPRCGCWHGDFIVDSDQDLPIGSTATIEDALTGFVATGKITRSKIQSLRLECRVVGGGGLNNTLPPRGYRNASLLLPLSDCLNDCDEALAANVSGDITSTLLAFWQTPKQTGAEELQALADTANVTWRVLLDGTVWLGREDWATIDREFTVIADNATQGKIELALDGLDAEILPGKTILDRRVSLVEWSIDPESTRCCVLFQRQNNTEDTKETDVAKQALERFVKRVTWRNRYHAYYAGRVVAQDNEGNVDVVLDTDDLPGLSKIPLRSFSPGVYLTVAVGCRVLVTFAEGDPSKPVAVLWEPASADLEKIKFGANAVKGAARIDDTTTNGNLGFSVGVSPNILKVTYTAPSGATQEVNVTFVSSSPITIAVAGSSQAITGKINSGSAKVVVG